MKRRRLAIIWSPEAEQDLLDIWQHTVDGTGQATPDTLLCEIDATTYGLGGWPQLGSARDHVREGLRARQSGRYVIFYRVVHDGIEVVRVLHERRDVEGIFPEEG